MPLGRHLAAATLAGLALAGAYAGGVALEAGGRQRIVAEAERTARDAAARARDALAVRAESLSVLAHNAIANPPLVAALRGRVDRRTLGDLFGGESWWAPYRECAVAVSYQGTTLAYAQPAAGALPLADMITEVRAHGEPVSQVLVAGSRVHLASAVAVPLSASQPPAVLVLARTVDDSVLDALGERAGGSLLVTDGKRALGGTGGDQRLLEMAVGREEKHLPPGDPAWAASAVSFARGLWLWAGARVSALAEAQAGLDRTRKSRLWMGGGALGAAALLLSLRPRRRKHEPPAGRTPAPLPERESLLGRYVLVDRIGEGGMAEVFTAVSFGAGGFRRSFVVKRLRPEMATNPTAVAHFIDEANLVSRLVHPNIVPVFDFGEIDGTHYIAQEYVVGRDLGRLTRRLLERDLPPLSPAAALTVADGVLAGLGYAHEERDAEAAPLGLVHRDVTPENVMVSRLGEVKLLDFGIVKANHRLAQTDIGTVKGSVDFMSPEQARGRAVDHRSDLFSAGLVLYACAARESLYRGETLYDRLTRAATGPGPDELARIAALPAPLAEVLEHALQIDLNRRFQSAAAFREAIAPHLAGGEAELAALITSAFGEELQGEQDRLAAAQPPEEHQAADAGASPGR
jgi:hypothetical protein